MMKPRICRNLGRLLVLTTWGAVGFNGLPALFTSRLLGNHTNGWILPVFARKEGSLPCTCRVCFSWYKYHDPRVTWLPGVLRMKFTSKGYKWDIFPSTPLKINMEPKHYPTEEENHLLSTSIFEFKMLIFGGVGVSSCQWIGRVSRIQNVQIRGSWSESGSSSPAFLFVFFGGLKIFLPWEVYKPLEVT